MAATKKVAAEKAPAAKKEVTAKVAADKVSAAKKSTKKIAISEDQIRERAYQIYVETGSSDSHANWAKAEAELAGKVK